MLQISLSERSAIVSVAATWMSAYDRKPRLRSLCDTLDSKGVRRAAIFVDGRGVVGQLEVAGCIPVGLPPPRPPPADVPAAPR